MVPRVEGCLRSSPAAFGGQCQVSYAFFDGPAKQTATRVENDSDNHEHNVMRKNNKIEEEAPQ